MKDVSTNWKLFTLSNLFSVDRGTRLIIQNRRPGIYPFATAGFTDQGISSFIDNEENQTYKNVITIDMFGNTFHRPYPFKCDDNIHVIQTSHLSRNISKFITTLISISIDSIYSYGKQFRLKSFFLVKIYLPINSKDEPDYEYMETYIRELQDKKEKEYLDYISKRYKELKSISRPVALGEKEWGTFKIIDVFTNIQRGRRLKKSDHKEGNIPYVSSTAMNNGVDGFVGNTKNVRVFNNCLTLANSGSVGATFFHPYRFVASDHVTKLENTAFNKYIYLFVASLIKRLSEKYSFNREINDTRVKKEKILLPINTLGQPDYEYMEQYMRYLEYEKLSSYIEFKRWKIK